MVKPIEDKVLSHFTLKPSLEPMMLKFAQNTRRNIPIPGLVTFNTDEYIHINLIADQQTIINLTQQCSSEIYDISFHSNRTTFLLQHNALHWMKEHDLHDDDNDDDENSDDESNDDSTDEEWEDSELESDGLESEEEEGDRMPIAQVLTRSNTKIQ